MVHQPLPQAQSLFPGPPGGGGVHQSARDRGPAVRTVRIGEQCHDPGRAVEGQRGPDRGFLTRPAPAEQLLAASGTPEAFADLSAALADLRAAPADDWNELARLDLRLHEVLVRSTGSKRLARMFGTLAAETRLCMVALESFYPRRADLVTEHAEIVEAIQQGDAGTATRLLEQHMSDSVQRLAGSVPAS